MEISQTTSALLSLISEMHAYGLTDKAKSFIEDLQGFPKAVAEEIVKLSPDDLEIPTYTPAAKRFAIGYYRWARNSLGIVKR